MLYRGKQECLSLSVTFTLIWYLGERLEATQGEPPTEFHPKGRLQILE
jgi:hypothetical protein